MWRKTRKAVAARNDLSAFIDEGSEIEGKYTFSGTVMLNGKFHGEIASADTLIIGEKGVVNANVQTVDAIIRGVYEGTMVATGNVEITATGRVNGNIETDSLVISKGGFFNGNVVKTGGREPKVPVYLVEDKRMGVPR